MRKQRKQLKRLQRKQLRQARKMLADGSRYQGGGYKDGKKHGLWVVIHKGTVRICEYKEGVRVGPLRKPKKGRWPSPKPTVRTTAHVLTRRWDYVKVRRKPLQGGRADGNRR